MKIKVNNIRKVYTENNETELIITTKENINIDDLKLIIANKKELSVEIKAFRKHRSLDSNSYMWVMLSKMADVMKTTKDELYLQVLDRYGVYTHIVVKPQAVSRIKAEWKVVRDLGEVAINGTTGQQLQCFFSSSSYDSKEMSVLINGVVEECKELGIETISKNELERMKSAWGR